MQNRPMFWPQIDLEMLILTLMVIFLRHKQVKKMYQITYFTTVLNKFLQKFTKNLPISLVNVSQNPIKLTYFTKTFTGETGDILCTSQTTINELISKNSKCENSKEASSKVSNFWHKKRKYEKQQKYNAVTHHHVHCTTTVMHSILISYNKYHHMHTGNIIPQQVDNR